MRTILSLLAFSMLSLAASAQVSLAPEVGLNVTNMKMKFIDPVNGGGVVSTGTRTSFSVGATAEYGLSKKLFLQWGLHYMGNGNKVNPGKYINVNSIELPLSLEYKQGTDGNSRFYIGLGPFCAYNFSGKTNLEGKNRSLKFGSDVSSDLENLDMGIYAYAGVLMSNDIFLRARYQQGITNLQPHGDANNYIRTSAVGLSIGYYFIHHHAPAKKKK